MAETAKYMTTTTAASNWKLTKATIAKHCRDGKMPGAFKHGGQWYIRAGSLKPLSLKDEKFFLRLILELKNRPEFWLDYEYEGINAALILPVCDWLLQRGLIKKFDRSTDIRKLLYEVCLTKKGMDAAFVGKTDKDLDIMKIVKAVAQIIPIIGEVIKMVRG